MDEEPLTYTEEKWAEQGPRRRQSTKITGGVPLQ
jgi:hypothetical protein